MGSNPIWDSDIFQSSPGIILISCLLIIIVSSLIALCLLSAHREENNIIVRAERFKHLSQQAVYLL